MRRTPDGKQLGKIDAHALRKGMRACASNEAWRALGARVDAAEGRLAWKAGGAVAPEACDAMMTDACERKPSSSRKALRPLGSRPGNSAAAAAREGLGGGGSGGNTPGTASDGAAGYSWVNSSTYGSGGDGGNSDDVAWTGYGRGSGYHNESSQDGALIIRYLT
mgnify:CR=1 FL=1